MKTPVLLISGWYDAAYGPIGATEGFRKMTQEGGSETARTHTRLILGPWNHTSPSIWKSKFGNINFGLSAGIDAESVYLQFFDCELKGICDDAGPRVNIFVMGENRWSEKRRNGRFPGPSLHRTIFIVREISGIPPRRALSVSQLPRGSPRYLCL